jgi:hypothetical protein
MRKIITLLSFSLLLTFSSIAQDIPVTEGIGCGKLKLGMSEKQVRTILGDSLEVKTYKEEMTDFWYHNRTLVLDSITQFVIGFDKCLILNDSLNKIWPVFKIYLLKDKVNCIIITSFLPEESLAKRVLINKKIRFNETLEKCRSLFGNDFIKTPYPGYEEFVYYKKGIQLLFRDEILKTIKIFKPVADYHHMIEIRGKKIREEFETIDKEKGGGFNWPD